MGGQQSALAERWQWPACEGVEVDNNDIELTRIQMSLDVEGLHRLLCLGPPKCRRSVQVSKHVEREG